MKEVSKITKCPYCGYDEYYEKVYISGRTNINYRFQQGELNREGENVGVNNSEVFDTLTYKQTSKYAYCGNCHKKVGVFKTGEHRK